MALVSKIEHGRNYVRDGKHTVVYNLGYYTFESLGCGDMFAVCTFVLHCYKLDINLVQRSTTLLFP